MKGLIYRGQPLRNSTPEEQEIADQQVEDFIVCMAETDSLAGFGLMSRRDVVGLLILFARFNQTKP